MCGIYGVVGLSTTKDVINSLKKLQYRGYDSCGIVYNYKNKYILTKAVGNVASLKRKVKNAKIAIALAHTRWATHGVVSEVNSHPHTTSNKRFYVVHNGVIDNYLEIKEKYNFELFTETDTEIVGHLMDLFTINNDCINALQLIQKELKGSYALVILDTKSNTLYFIKKDSPLLLGIGNSKIVISSDQIAFEQNMNVTILNDDNYGYISKDNYQIYSNNLNEKWNTFYKIEESSITKKTKYYMLDEILEQPNVLERIYKTYQNISTEAIKDELLEAKEIAFIGAGSSYYASLILKHYYEKDLKIRCHAIVASEIDSFNIIYKNTLFIFLSQSGETADLAYCVKLLKNKGYKIISLCNIVNSTIGYNSDIVFPLLANEEISVASTKAFLAMIFVGQIILNKNYLNNYFNYISYINNSISSFNYLNLLINNIILANNVFFIGKGIDYIIALEASLKLKEIAYINSYAYQSGELKHGSIALIDESSVCIAIVTDKDNELSTLNNLEEVKSRGAKVYRICEESIYAAIPLIQLIAFLSAKKLNRNIDQPKNLAKSVTVK